MLQKHKKRHQKHTNKHTHPLSVAGVAGAGGFSSTLLVGVVLALENIGFEMGAIEEGAEEATLNGDEEGVDCK